MEVTVIGGGIGGLAAAIEVAERGLPVVLHERSSTLGGRARTAAGPYRTNFGPHAIYRDGALWAWLAERDLLPPTRPSNPATVRFVWRGKARRGLPRPVAAAMLRSFRAAPADVSYREWLGPRMPADRAEACCRVACFYTFAADPGRLSARFVNERNARLVRPPSPARFVSDGGWQAVVDAMAGRARDLGVDIRLRSRVEMLPAPPVIVATEPAAAAELLRSAFEVPTADAVLLDVALVRPGRAPTAVIDLDGGAFIERYTAFDRGLAPEGEELLQCHAGVEAGEEPEASVQRIETALDAAFPGWREQERWRAVRRARGRSGALDTPAHPGSSRPAVDRGDGVHLVGDWVDAPGLLSEVAIASATRAAAAAAATRPRRPA